MFIGGLLGCLLDNLIPGNPEDRGITKWRNTTSLQGPHSQDSPSIEDTSVYDLPFITPFLKKHKIFKFIPICSTFVLTFGDTRKEPEPINAGKYVEPVNSKGYIPEVEPKKGVKYLITST